MTEQATKPFMTLQEVAEHLTLSYNHVRRMYVAWGIPHYRTSARRNSKVLVDREKFFVWLKRWGSDAEAAIAASE